MRDLIFKRLLSICCILILLISAGMIYSLVSGSIPALSHYGFFQFIGSTEWDRTEKLMEPFPLSWEPS